MAKPVARVSLVVPASNEAPVIPRLMDSLLQQRNVQMDIALIANGCQDDTAAIAYRYAGALSQLGHRLQLIELEEASKVGAFRAGDRALGDSFPRAYVDADVTLSAGALASVACALDTAEPRLAAPRLRFRRPADIRGARLAAFAESIPPFSDRVVGGGFYAVNRAGRTRWGDFPDVLADDAFVVGRFGSEETIRIDDVEFYSRFPERGRILGVLSRWELGRLELRALGVASRNSTIWEACTFLVQRPRLWRQAVLWFGLKTLASALARARWERGDRSWDRAD
jgi:glycosyltransferase involved in cell wall biosynthesis